MPRCYFSIVALLILVIFIKLEMMQNEKTVGILAILLIIVIGIGKFFYSDGMFLNIFIKEFNTTVNIVTKARNS